MRVLDSLGMSVSFNGASVVHKIVADSDTSRHELILTYNYQIFMLLSA
jgi:hypothetical protein